MFRGSLWLRVYFLLLVFLIKASFSKDDEKPVSKKININYIKLVSMGSLGTFLWLTGHQVIYVHSMGLQLKSTFVPPATCLVSPVLQVKTQAFQLLHCCLSYFSFSELKSDSKVGLNQKFKSCIKSKIDAVSRQ